jgi:hypothetical protein
MRAGPIVIFHVTEQQVMEVALAEYNNVVKAFPSDRTDQPFSIINRSMELKVCFLGAVLRRTFICCRSIQISASSAARDRIRSTTIKTMSLTRIHFAKGSAATSVDRGCLSIGVCG